MLFTIPATVRPLFIGCSSFLNASFTVDINLTSGKSVYLFSNHQSVLFTLPRCLVTNFLQQADKRLAFRSGQGLSRQPFHIASVFTINARDEPFAFPRKMNDSAPAARAVPPPLAHPPLFQAVNRHGDRATRQQDLFSNFVDRERSFVQQ